MSTSFEELYTINKSLEELYTSINSTLLEVVRLTLGSF